MVTILISVVWSQKQTRPAEQTFMWNHMYLLFTVVSCLQFFHWQSWCLHVKSLKCFSSQIFFLKMQNCCTDEFSVNHVLSLLISVSQTPVCYHICCSNSGWWHHNCSVIAGNLYMFHHHSEACQGSCCSLCTLPEFVLSFVYPTIQSILTAFLLPHAFTEICRKHGTDSAGIGWVGSGQTSSRNW